MMRVIGSEAELREYVAPPPRFIAEKGIDHIDPESRRFIEMSPFFLLATSAADGTCDVSPRGDPAGSVLVLDDRTLAFADRKGNGRLDSLTNLLQRPRVGMVFMVPGSGDTVRVNGRARIVAEAPYLDRLAMRNVVPQLAVEVVVEELFLHCARAFTRSRLWDTATWPVKGDVPSAGRIAKSISGTEVEAEVIDDALDLAAADPY
ncbi:MSMEG_1061 family FMN-dependent PPOX-type flavoprotein [Paractinoplanes hotanensis]|uniref:Pyridoxamine 5'-phosphate oxidase family protein n=1 Tax=Paractinoplanes hotanensis TaxID=2906497 RepID=A0ABT0Y376_9ACTN|nr:MSMEG_1061 family FMN-dependent PPOX-type flavoprotein [Actinoplanes hotanensis]MCM4080300.1 pyridoxamine 5'-phosphate oxidase family protein [Actinoplanes hotanensis]